MKKSIRSIIVNNEGLWLPNQFPKRRCEKLYQFEPSDEWLLCAQRACVRLMSGGSGSFVSSNGLLITNHHVAESVLYDMGPDYLKTGFYAKEQKDEKKSPALEVNVLWEIEDVTDRVKAALRPDMKAAKAQSVLDKVRTQIEDESVKETGMRSDVVTLYNGGQYHLYRYKKYTDVRLVFAPEKAIASFGGDIDNFTFPRYCLDVAFFRVYEDDKPLHTPCHFTWETKNSSEGELQFIAGHPGNTDRLTTLSRILHLRDFGLPYQLNLLRRDEINAQQFGGLSTKNYSIAWPDLHRAQNTRKCFGGQLAALQDPSFVEQIAAREKILRDVVDADPKLKQKHGVGWDLVASADKALLPIRDRVNLVSGGGAFASQYFNIARTLVRMAAEDKKPSHKRLPKFADAGRDSLLHYLFSPAPIYSDYEKHKLTDSLSLMLEVLGSDDELVEKVLAGKSPEARASELVDGTGLADVKERKLLAENDAQAITASTDPFILLAKLVDPEARKLRKMVEQKVSEPRRKGYELIAAAQFEVFGKDVYPDATFTLRFVYGQMRGHKEADTPLPAYTTIGQVFAHADKHENKGLWELPKSWKKRKTHLQTCTMAFNMLSDHDCHGGNSGSPVFTKDMKIVGVLFDGTVPGLGCKYLHPDFPASVSVHTAGVTYVLKSVYEAQRLVSELSADH